MILFITKLLLNVCQRESVRHDANVLSPVPYEIFSKSYAGVPLKETGRAQEAERLGFLHFMYGSNQTAKTHEVPPEFPK